MKNTLSTVLLVLLALVAADLFLNDGRGLASITSGNDTAAVIDTAVQAVDGQSLNNIILPPASSGTPAGVTFAVIDDGEPVIRNLVPIPPATAEPEQPPEAIINWSEELARPTATHRALTDEQLLACVSAQQDGRRPAPYCPTDAAELLGEGR
jgi:hypothetical protein